MAMTDPLGDLLTRIRNGQQARKDSILTPASKLRAHVLDVLQREGYIRGYAEEELAGQRGLRIELKYFESQIRLTPLVDAQRNRAVWGMTRTNVQNLVTGVTEGFTKVLEITGVGYRAQAQGRNLRLQLGYSHDVNYKLPEGVEVKTPDQNTVEITGIDKQKVGQVAAEIRRWRKPEPYKGKGIKYRGEYIYRKEGKKK